jgi:glucose 1-dehydrogenase
MTNATARLAGKIALITGSDSGIGQATAAQFAKEGADLVVHYLEDAEGAEQTRKAVEAEGRRAIVVQADVSDEDQVGDMFDQAEREYGTLDILVNNAGVDASGTKVAELSTEVWDRRSAQPVRLLLLLPRFAQIRTAAGGGASSSTSARCTRTPNAGAADYDCSKGRSAC